MRDRFVPGTVISPCNGCVNRFDAFHDPTLRDLAPYLVSASKLFFQPRARSVFNPAMQPLQIANVIAQGSAEALGGSSNKYRARAPAGSRRYA